LRKAYEAGAIRLEGFVLRDEEPDRPIRDDDPFGLVSVLEYAGDDTIPSDLALQVYVDIEHPFRTDLEVTLASPAGTRVGLLLLAA
jgi:subtilisin-like proprotein convertase family protein